jgi:hypothetical protein
VQIVDGILVSFFFLAVGLLPRFALGRFTTAGRKRAAERQKDKAFKVVQRELLTAKTEQEREEVKKTMMKAVRGVDVKEALPVGFWYWLWAMVVAHLARGKVFGAKLGQKVKEELKVRVKPVMRLGDELGLLEVKKEDGKIQNVVSAAQEEQRVEKEQEEDRAWEIVLAKKKNTIAVELNAEEWKIIKEAREKNCNNFAAMLEMQRMRTTFQLGALVCAVIISILLSFQP